MNCKGHHSISVEEAMKLVTGKTPDPIEMSDPVLLEQKAQEGAIRRAHRITERSDWLAQLRRFHPDAAIPSD